MKKMFVAFGIAIALVAISVVGTSIQAQAAEEPSVEEQLEEAFTELVTEQYPDHTIDKVDVMSIDKDYYYGGYTVMFTYEFDGNAGFTAVSMNTLDC